LRQVHRRHRVRAGPARRARAVGGRGVGEDDGCAG
jgi:hypothetical protein